MTKSHPKSSGRCRRPNPSYMDSSRKSETVSRLMAAEDKPAVVYPASEMDGTCEVARETRQLDILGHMCSFFSACSTMPVETEKGAGPGMRCQPWIANPSSRSPRDLSPTPRRRCNRCRRDVLGSRHTADGRSCLLHAQVPLPAR